MKRKSDSELMRKHPYLFFTPYEPIGEETIEGLKDKAHMEKFILEIQITKLIKKHLLSLYDQVKNPYDAEELVQHFLYDLFNEFERNNPDFNPEVLMEIFKQEEEEV